MNKFDAVDILIVEDNPADAELIMHALKKHNLANTVFAVEDGEQALDYIYCRGCYRERQFSKTPKVIFLELKLPKINGLETLKTLKSDAATRRIPVVIVTSSRENPDIKAAYELGVNSYIVKPIDFEAFTRVMSDAGFYWLLVNQSAN